jgi:hypothetical protein
VRTLLARDPADRPASYEVLLKRFEEVLSAPAPKPARSKAPALVVGIAALAGGGWFAASYLGRDTQAEPIADSGDEFARVEPETFPLVPPVDPRTPTTAGDGGAPGAADAGGEGDDGAPDPQLDAAGGDEASADPVAPEPPPVEPVDPAPTGPPLPRIQPEETWPLFHGTSPLEAWDMSAGSRGDWSPLEESRNGAQAFVFESLSRAERGLPAPPWVLAGELEMVRAARVVTQRLSVLVHLGPDDAIELGQGVVEDEVRLFAERVRGPAGSASREPLAELALGPLTRVDYASVAPVAFRVLWDGERLEVAWSFARSEGSERTLELSRSDFAGPVRFGFELEGGAAVLRDFVVEGR